MKSSSYIVVLLLNYSVFYSQATSQIKRASQYIDLIPSPPSSLTEARNRLLQQNEDIAIVDLRHDLEANSDTTRPLTVEDIVSNADSHLLSAKPKVDYYPIMKKVESEWSRVEDSIIILVQNPKLAFQNAIVLIGEERVKTLEACKRKTLKRHVPDPKQDSLCSMRAEKDADRKRDMAAIDYLKTIRKNWDSYKRIIKSFVARQEHRLDSVRVLSVEVSLDVQARKINATLMSVVKMLLQTAGDITKSAVEAGAR